MADIISFYAAWRRYNSQGDRHTSHKVVSGPAQLLFFTGVRYERPVIDIQLVAKKKPRKRKPVSVQTDTAIVS